MYYIHSNVCHSVNYSSTIYTAIQTEAAIETYFQEYISKCTKCLFNIQCKKNMTNKSSDLNTQSYKLNVSEGVLKGSSK